MEESESNDPSSIYQYMLKKDKSLIYIGVISSIVVLTMAYLTFFVDDVNTLFKRHPETAVVSENSKKTDLLNESSGMDDAQVRKSMIKFVEAYYYDQRRGYFDPPSYFANITNTYYNFHNLTFQRLKDVHWMRMKDMQHLDVNWIVSSLEFERVDDDLVITYWTKVNYFKPSRNAQESADIKNEMIVNEEGKIISLRELEVKNFKSFVVEPVDSLVTEELEESELDIPELEMAPPAPSSREVKPEIRSDSRVYDLSSVETVPEFRGGQRRLARYLRNRLNYPAQARQNRVQGTVFVSFIVEKNGSLSGVYVTKGIGSGCDEEAMRVIKNSPEWHPGTIGGKPVRTSYTVPVSFKL